MMERKPIQELRETEKRGATSLADSPHEDTDGQGVRVEDGHEAASPRALVGGERAQDEEGRLVNEAGPRVLAR
jgi:hypothetical protein